MADWILASVLMIACGITGLDVVLPRYKQAYQSMSARGRVDLDL